MVDTKLSTEPRQGRRYSSSRQVRLSQEQEALLRGLAERWGCRQVDVIRRLIVEAGTREGMTTQLSREPIEPDGQSSEETPVKPIWEKIIEIMEQVPEEIRATLP